MVRQLQARALCEFWIRVPPRSIVDHAPHGTLYIIDHPAMIHVTIEQLFSTIRSLLNYRLSHSFLSLSLFLVDIITITDGASMLLSMATTGVKEDAFGH